MILKGVVALTPMERWGWVDLQVALGAVSEPRTTYLLVDWDTVREGQRERCLVTSRSELKENRQPLVWSLQEEVVYDIRSAYRYRVNQALPRLVDSPLGIPIAHANLAWRWLRPRLRKVL